MRHTAAFATSLDGSAVSMRAALTLKAVVRFDRNAELTQPAFQKPRRQVLHQPVGATAQPQRSAGVLRVSRVDTLPR
jgi:hypothetical protein